MGGDDHRRILRVVAENGVQNVVPGSRVHTADGFVQQIQLRLTAHGQNQLNFFLGAFGQMFEPLAVCNLQIAQHLFGLAAVEVRVKVGKHPHQLPHGHPVWQIIGIRQIGDHLLGLRSRRLSIDLDGAGGGHQKAVGHFDQRRLAAAVGAQQTDDFSAPHMQFQLIQCPLGPIPFAQGSTSQ